jgi:hypothetical protein
MPKLEFVLHGLSFPVETLMAFLGLRYFQTSQDSFPVTVSPIKAQRFVRSQNGYLLRI